MKGWVMRAPGPPDSLELTELPDPEPQEGWVLVDIRAFGLNRAELMTRQGHSGDAVPLPRVLGIECVGSVADPGGTDLAQGQTVAVAVGGMGRKFDGGYATKGLFPRNNVMPLETKLDWPTLGALPESYLTAWGALIDSCGAKKGETVLIRGGSSSVGLAAASLVKNLGGTSIATTRSQNKAAALETAGVDEVVIDDGGVAEQVRELAPDGVDRVVELVGSVDSITDSLQALRPQGVLCLVGFLGGEWDYGLPWPPPTVRITFYTTEVITTEASTPVLQDIVNGIQDSTHVANVHEVFDFEDLPRAHELMESNGAAGKLVVTTPG
jgi:NADPH:quinone reductase-like Zn-dependent oxidoreductase